MNLPHVGGDLHQNKGAQPEGFRVTGPNPPNPAVSGDWSSTLQIPFASSNNTFLANWKRQRFLHGGPSWGGEAAKYAYQHIRPINHYQPRLYICPPDSAICSTQLSQPVGREIRLVAISWRTYSRGFTSARTTYIQHLKWADWLLPLTSE